MAITDDVLREALTVGSAARVLAVEDSALLIEGLWQKFTTSPRRSRPLWEHLHDAYSIHDPEGWRKIASI